MKPKTALHRMEIFFVSVAMLAALVIIALQLASAQKKEVVWSADEKPLADQIHGLRALADDVRAETTKDLALKIRKLPATDNKLRLAGDLAGLSTEGDFGHDTLQEVATTLAETLRERPVPWAKPAEKKNSDAGSSAAAPRAPAYPYIELATLVRYEHVEALVYFNNDEQFRAAMAGLEADDRKREHPEFTLKDLSGKTWKFSELRGKVVLVNFWATWCPPCRKEMPDLETLYGRFGSKGLVVLGISDEEAFDVGTYLLPSGFTYPILVDPSHKAWNQFHVEALPQSFVFDRAGKLVTH